MKLIDSLLCGTSHQFLQLYGVCRRWRESGQRAICQFRIRRCVLTNCFQNFQLKCVEPYRITAVNFVFAIPAVWLIDSFGRRSLLLSTFPLMVIFLLCTGLSFLAPVEGQVRLALTATVSEGSVT